MRTLLLTLTLFIFAGVLYQPEKGIAKTGKGSILNLSTADLKSGDIVLRQGKGFISEVFRKSSLRDRQFSHAGIIQVTRNGVFVVHVIGTSGNGGTDLKTEPVEEFCSSYENRSFAIFRYSFLSGKETQINQYLDSIKLQPVRFDQQFELASDESLYCSELVYKMCLSAASYPLNITRVDGKNYVGLDDLYFDSSANLITKQTY
jgi:hypothetical protein